MCFLLNIIFDTSGFYDYYNIVRIWRSQWKIKTSKFHFKAQTEQKYADVVIHMAKK